MLKTMIENIDPEIVNFKFLDAYGNHLKSIFSQVKSG